MLETHNIRNFEVLSYEKEKTINFWLETES